MKPTQQASHLSLLLALTFTMPAMVLADQHQHKESKPFSTIDQNTDQRAEYRKEIDTRMEKVKSELQRLEIKSKEMSRETRRDFKDMKNDANDKLKNLEDQWRDFSNKTDAQWDQAKIKLDQSWDQFMTHFNKQKTKLIKEKS